MTPNKANNLARHVSKTIARLLLCVMCVIPFLFSASAAKAQAAPVLLLSPTPVTFYLNGPSTQMNVDLMAQNVVNMNAYEFVLSYDPAILEFVSVTPGSWLSPGTKFYSSYTPGRIHYAYALVGGTPVSGNGKLATITFKAIGFGSSALTFSEPLSCKYARGDGSQQLFNLQGGSVSTTFDPNGSAAGSVAGTFSLQGQTNSGGVPVTLDNGVYLDDGPFSGVSLSQAGTNLSINPVMMDIYTVTTNQSRYLNIDAGCGKTKTVFGTTNTLSPLKLKGGNAVWTDNVINMQDISAILGVYGEASTVAAPLEADINANGTVDVYDLAMAAGNYGLTCATAYANWVP